MGKRHNLLLNMDLTGLDVYRACFPATKRDMAQKHKNCVGSSVFPKSQVYRAQGAEHAQQQIAAFSLVKNSSQEQEHVTKPAYVTSAACPAAAALECLERGYRLEALSWFVSLLPVAVFLCLCHLLGEGPQGTLSWQAAYQLCCGDLCNS